MAGIARMQVHVCVFYYCCSHRQLLVVTYHRVISCALLRCRGVVLSNCSITNKGAPRCCCCCTSSAAFAHIYASRCYTRIVHASARAKIKRATIRDRRGMWCMPSFNVSATTGLRALLPTTQSSSQKHHRHLHHHHRLRPVFLPERLCALQYQ